MKNKYLFIKLFKLVFILILMSQILYSCKNKNKIIFSKEVVFINNLWEKDHTLSFLFQITDTSAKYDALIKVMLDTNYTFNTFVYSINLITPDGSLRQFGFQTDIKDYDNNIELPIIGDSWLIDKKVFEDIKFNKYGQYKIELKHNMPLDLFFVKSVELIISKK